MKKMICLLIALLMPVLAMAEAGITVNGNAEMCVPAELVTVSAQVSCTAKTLLEAQNQAAIVTAKATANLTAFGIAEEDMTTGSYSYYPTYDYSGSMPVLTGYQVEHTLNVVLRDPSRIDLLVQKLGDAGITMLGGMTYDVNDRAALYEQALTAALQNARGKANVLAAAEGLSEVNLVSVQEQSSGYVATYTRKTTMADYEAAAGSGYEEAGIRTGTVSVSASVTAEFTAK